MIENMTPHQNLPRFMLKTLTSFNYRHLTPSSLGVLRDAAFNQHLNQPLSTKELFLLQNCARHINLMCFYFNLPLILSFVLTVIHDEPYHD